MQKLNVGLAGCYQTNLDVAFCIGHLKRSIEALERLSREENFSHCATRKGAFSQNGAVRAKKSLRKRKWIFFPFKFPAGDICKIPTGSVQLVTDTSDKMREGFKSAFSYHY